MKWLQSSFATFLAAAVILGGPHPRLPAANPDNYDVQPTSKEAAASVGTYVGFFGPHKITLSIEKIVGDTILGYSVVKGNERAFSGTWEREIEGISFVGKEPGDHAEDGVFTMKFDPKEKVLTGRWEAVSKTLAPVDLVLKARKFKYDPKAGQYPKGSTKLLKESDVENMRPAELRIMRNEIYARHGYSFTLEDMQQHFATADWYMPVVLDVKDKLTPTETKNAELIKRYEKYGEDYYDRFGR